MKLTIKQKQLVKEYAQSLVKKRNLNEFSDKYKETWENSTMNDLSDLFKKLVPSQGKAETIEGEMVRAANRIVYRAHNDGDVFNRGYGKETVNPSVKWLVSRKELKGIRPFFTAGFKASAPKNYNQKYDYDTESYIKEILPALKKIVDYVKSKNGKYTPNPDSDSR